MLTDTCPACGKAFEFAADGIRHRCPYCRRGFLWWVPDDLASQLRAQLAEAEGYEAEGLAGAAELVASIRARLERLAREAEWAG